MARYDGELIAAGEVAFDLGDLARAGLVESTNGKFGGYRLRRDPAELTLLELIETIEGPSRSVQCVLEERPCGDDRPCALRPGWYSRWNWSPNLPTNRRSTRPKTTGR